MFGFFKNLLRRQANGAGNGEPTQACERQAAPEAPAPTRPSASAFSNRTRNGNGTGTTVITRNPAYTYRQQPGNGSGASLEVPLQPVIGGLPLEVQPLVIRPDVGDRTILVPLEKVLAQLSRGSVRLSFGEVRSLAPGVFADDPNHDRVQVLLPLGDILARLNPALIQRRRVQRQVEVPADIVSPFDLHSQAMMFSAAPVPAKPETAAPAPVARETAPASLPVPGRKFISGAPVPTPPMGPAPSAPPLSPSRIPIPMPPAAPAVPVAPAPAIPMPAAQPAVPVPASAPAPVAEKQDKSGVDPIVVGLTLLAETWPEAVRKEVVALHLVEAKVALPADLIEQALKQGRIAFSWKTVRSWIRPSPLPAVSAHDSAVLELPLKVVAPLFIARQQAQNRNQNKVSIDAEIPNLFFGFPNADNNAAAVTRPADTNYYVWDDRDDAVRTTESDGRRGPSPSTQFLSKYATPNEIVSRAAALDGVVGTLIALPDGLMVANRLPPDLNPDTVAAFLPQIFAKMSQCTKELRMGELNNLNFTVGNVPWKIFRVNAIFFAAFGRAGAPLPTADLAALAAELDHKPR